MYACNRPSEVRVLPPGVYGLTNTHIDDVWPKSARGIAALGLIAATAATDDALSVLCDDSADYLPGDREQESARRATPAFLRGEDYGTRASTAVVFDRGRIAFAEQQYGPMGEPGGRVTETIRVREAGTGGPIATDGSALDDRKAAL